MADPTLAPNHHADHPGFSGATGWLAAQTMRFGRAEVADLAGTLVGLTTGERLVDVGSGPGVAARRAAARGAVVTGVEPSEVMLRVARGDDDAGAVTWRPGAAEALPLEDASYDVAWSLSAVHHWPDLDGGLAEVLRVLVPGGRFLAIERRTHAGATGLASHGWTDGQAEAFADACRAAGFADAAVTTHQVKRGPVLAVLATAPSGGRGR